MLHYTRGRILIMLMNTHPKTSKMEHSSFIHPWRLFIFWKMLFCFVLFFWFFGKLLFSSMHSFPKVDLRVELKYNIYVFLIKYQILISHYSQYFCPYYSHFSWFFLGLKFDFKDCVTEDYTFIFAEELDGGEYLFAFRMLMVLFRREFSFVDSLYLWEVKSYYLMSLVGDVVWTSWCEML